MSAIEGEDSWSWEVLGKRWVRCGVLNAVVAAALWVIWELVSPESGWGFWSIARFVVFQLAQVMFLLAQKLVMQPEDLSPVSVMEFVVGGLSLAWRAAIGSSVEESPIQAYAVVQKMRDLRDITLLILLMSTCGFLTLSSLSSSVDMGIRGAALGICYFGWYMLRRRHLLRFPIIQRKIFFCIKLGLPSAVTSALRIALLSVPVAETLVYLFHSTLDVDRTEMNRFSIWHQAVFLVGAFFSTLSWNICCHLIQVVHTRRYIFAPPSGSAAAETNPTEPLLSILEEEDKTLRYLGFLDLYVISSISDLHVEAWRRAALFEETGQTYKKVISICLQPLDRITLTLIKGLESMQAGQAVTVKKQSLATGEQRFDLNFKDSFKDSQLCAWCACIVSSLTAFSRKEDRYGVAQLSGSNSAVLSTLISCLLIVEMYLGRRGSYEALSFVGSNGTKLEVPYRGGFMDAERRQNNFIFRKKSLLHKKAQAMADVVRRGIYSIVSEFRDEMLVVSSGSDWLGRNKPLFGTPEMHLDKLNRFLQFVE